MIEHTFRFEVTDPDTIELPADLLREGGRYRVDLHDGDVYISGNTNGLLYLAHVLVQCAKGGFSETFHVHIRQDSESRPPDGSGPPPAEVVVFAGEL
ncbi:hypothetical protein [Gemmatimonas aurantiaca]|uniref:hypothetical protein n=1 Tax=Gemmatimonas aurantiaca TaxID=173480 RepID=UPI00301D31D8